VLLGAMAVVGALAVVIQVLVALAVRLAPAGERGRVIGVVTGGVVAGLVVARTAAGVINDALGWRAVFALAALLTGTLGAVLWRRLPATAVVPARSYRRLVAGLPRLYRAHRVLRQRAVLAVAIFATFNVLWTPLAEELAGRPHQLSSTAIGLFGLVGITGALTARRAGRLADRGFDRAASGSALVLMLAAWLPIALAGWSVTALVAGMVLIDVSVQTVHVISQSVVTAVDPGARSSLVAAYMVCYSVGSAAGAAGSTALHAAHGWAGVVILGATTSAVGLVYWTMTGTASADGERTGRRSVLRGELLIERDDLGEGGHAAGELGDELVATTDVERPEVHVGRDEPLTVIRPEHVGTTPFACRSRVAQPGRCRDRSRQ